MKSPLFIFLGIFLFSQGVFGQNQSIPVPMDEAYWEMEHNAKHSFETIDGRKTMALHGKAVVKGQTFSNGTIEVDVYATQSRGFAGIIFRKQDGRMEEAYMRMHKSTQVDAIQYAPTYNGELTWQLYREYQAKVRFKNTGWNKFRLEIANEQLDVYVNDEKVLHIDRMETDHRVGEIGLFALFDCQFSNFRYTPKKVQPSTKEKLAPAIDPNIITEWQLTAATPLPTQALNFKEFANAETIKAQTEASGLLPISKHLKRASSGQFERNQEFYTVASTTIITDQDETQAFSFDYSDKIMVYLNGKLLYHGNNAFRAKGPEHKGHIGINTNKLFLDLKKGKNTLHCVVIDKANGWGLIGKLEQI